MKVKMKMKIEMLNVDKEILIQLMILINQIMMKMMIICPKNLNILKKVLKIKVLNRKKQGKNQ